MTYASLRRPVIYLDYNATTPLRPEVFAAMKPFLTERWGNPSSSYTFGSKLKAEVEAARRAVAQLVNTSSSEIIFTGSATEADNTALNAALASQPGKRHIITSAVEHSAVLLARAHKGAVVVTTDHRDFSTYRVPFISPKGEFHG